MEEQNKSNNKVKVDFGVKGRKPIKAQRSPRPKSKFSDFDKFKNAHHNGNHVEAESVVQAYFNGNAKFKESVLVVYICNHQMTMRMAKAIFKIGSHKYNRIKECREKQKPGGDKPSFMTEVKIERMRLFFSSLQYEIGFPCIHRELKNYIDDDDLTTWPQVYNKYLEFPIVYNINEESEGIEKDSDDNESDDDAENEVDDAADDDEEHDDDDNDGDDEAEGYVIDNKIVPKTSVLPEVMKRLSSKQKEYYRHVNITAFSTWFKYKGIFFPHISLQRLKEDCCDTCEKYNLMLADDKLNEEERRDIETTLQMHQSNAKAQRSALKEILKTVAAEVLQDSEVGVDAIAEYNACIDHWTCNHETSTKPEEIFLSSAHDLILNSERRLVDVESHDYGGNLCMPYWGIRRPGLDYYLSNLNLYMFVMSEITKYGTKHNMYVYDERAAGKDADALCSLRFFYYLRKYITRRNNGSLDKRAVYLFVTMDNCVGQNKSNAVLQMFSMLCILGIYEGCICHYLEAGHSHGTSDVGVAHAKRPLKKNYFVPEDMVKEMNTVQGIHAEYLDFRQANKSFGKRDYVFRGEWSKFLCRHLKPIPYLPGIHGYTKCHSFQIYGNGTCVMNLYANSGPDTEYRHEYIDSSDVAHVRSTIIKELFPNSDGTLNTIALSDLNEQYLPILQNRTLAPAKMASLAMKRDNFVDPSRKAYYPSEVWDIVLDASLNDLQVKKPEVKKAKVKKVGAKIIKADSIQAKKAKKEPSLPTNQRTMFGYLTGKNVLLHDDGILSPPVTNNSSIPTQSNSNDLMYPSSTKLAFALTQSSQSSVENCIPDGSEEVTEEYAGLLNYEDTDKTEGQDNNVVTQSDAANNCEWSWELVKYTFQKTKREFLDKGLRSIDFNLVMNRDIFTVSTDAKYTLQRKEIIFPVMCEYIGTVLGHKYLTSEFPCVQPKCYNDENMYLQVQNQLGCWMHCLFALLGESFHTHFTWSPWILATLTSFIQFDKGTEEALEPLVLSDLGISGVPFLHEILADQQKSCEENEADIEFCYAQPIMSLTSAGMTRFVASYGQSYAKTGMSKIMAHALFSSLCNPYGRKESDIYIGAYKVTDGSMNCVQQLIAEFELKMCNVIIICCPCHTDSRDSSTLHYVTVFLTSNKEVWFYDPRVGLEKPTPHSTTVLGYAVPSVLHRFKNAKPSVIFIGERRCAFYFKLPLDECGRLDEIARKNVEWNVNERFFILLQQELGISGFKDPGQDSHAFADVVSLQDKNFDPNAVFQNRLVKVKPSYLRSLETGNPIGLGLYSKVSFENKAHESIGSWKNGKITCLNAQETMERNEVQPMAQFYSVSLQLKKEVMRDIRAAAGLLCNEEDLETCTATLECIEAARDGLCLMSYANTIRNTYHRYGWRLCHNADIKLPLGSTIPRLRPSKGIRIDEEILWPYAVGLRMPTSTYEEKMSRIGGDEYENEWPYEFTRSEVMVSMTMFRSIHSLKYDEAMELLRMCTNKKSTDVIAHYRDLDITADMFAQCRLVPEDRDIKLKKARKAKSADKDKQLPVTAFYCNDTIMDSFFGSNGMLDQLDRYLCSQNPRRRRSLILRLSTVESLHTIRDRVSTRKFKNGIVREGFNFFDMEKILIPVHQNQHFTMFVVFMQARDIVYYDTLNFPYPSCITKHDLLDYIEDEARICNVQFQRSQWSLHKATVVQQGNGLDCGYCVIKHGMLVLQDLPLDLEINMNDFRLQTAIQLKDGYLSLHPAAKVLQTMIPKDLVTDPDAIDDSIVSFVEVIPRPMHVVGGPLHDIPLENKNISDEFDEDGFEVHRTNSTSEEFN